MSNTPSSGASGTSGAYGTDSQTSGLCPPGQEKNGNCTPRSGSGFCPPGQGKKGNC
jgi:hypothetical protein